MGQIIVDALTTDHIPLLQELDAAIFPQHMLLSEAEYVRLTSIPRSILVIYQNLNQTQGAAFGIPATAMEAELQETDPNYTAVSDELYSYSEAVLPQFQRQGIGTEIVRTLGKVAVANGFTKLSAHVRTDTAWVSKRKHVLPVELTRSVPHFWGEDGEPVEYQLADLLKLL